MGGEDASEALVGEGPRRASVVRRESVSASTDNVNWSGTQAHAGHILGSDEVKRNADDENVIESPKGRVTLTLVITAAATIFGSSFPHGWNTGVLNNPAHLIHQFLNESYMERFGSEPEAWKLDLLWATSVSVYLIGGCGGAFSVGWFANTFGRKKGLLVCHVFSYVAAVLFAFCNLAKSFEMLVLARLITGFGCGAGSGLVPMYLTEIAPVNIRGAMGVLHQFALTCGILTSQCFGLRQVLGREVIWPILLAFIVVPCTVSVCVLPWFPESPRYLLVNKQQDEEAEKALKRFRGRDDVSADMEEMRKENEIQKKEKKWTFGQLFKNNHLRLPLLLVSALAMCQQLSGINVVFYYSNGIFLSAGIPPEMVQYANIGTGLVNVIMTGISVPLMEKSGRRLLLLGGMVVMIVSAGGLTAALNLHDKFTWISYLSVVCLIVFVVGFAIGLGSIPQFIGAELFKQGPRPPAMSFAGLLNWLCNFIVGITFPSMQSALKAYSFLVFIFAVVGFGIFLWWKLPETKGQTYDEIYRRMGIDTSNDDDVNAKDFESLPLTSKDEFMDDKEKLQDNASSEAEKREEDLDRNGNVRPTEEVV